MSAPRTRFGAAASGISWAVFAAIGLRIPGPAFAQHEVIGAGDVLKIEVFGEADLSGTFSVREDGKVKINWVEPIAVAGKNVESAQEEIRRYLDEKYVINPKVSVSIAEYKSRTVSMMGEVTKPGLYRLETNSTLLSVLLEAGGPTGRAADEIVVLRPKDASSQDYDTRSASLQRLLSRASPEDNLSLLAGDIVYISSAGDTKGRESAETVYVLGAVKNSGSFAYRKGYTALDAVIDAGGVTKYASPNGTKIFRGRGEKRETISIRLGDVMTKGDRSKNVELKAGDYVIVPQRFL
ncbi:MAG TPA: polysaccharide biosynthesis/export family protein [Bdellovibrionota bacterium]|nr:polysaccharide biosynthesis/export family protein [Bdellovibrionota bacterium]